jgi:hypothetical protein
MLSALLEESLVRMLRMLTPSQGWTLLRLESSFESQAWEGFLAVPLGGRLVAVFAEGPSEELLCSSPGTSVEEEPSTVLPSRAEEGAFGRHLACSVEDDLPESLSLIEA